jgi:signal transduction histidine kinase
MHLFAADRRHLAAWLSRPQPGDPLAQALRWLRWTILATMLLITLAWPTEGRGGHQIWALVLVFAAYNLLVELIRAWLPPLRGFGWVPLLDLPVAGLLYFLDAEPGGPLFVAFYLAVLTAAICWPLRPTLVYTAAVVVLIVLIAPTLPQWTASPGSIRQLAARMVVLAMVGGGTALLMRRMAAQEEGARAGREEAARLEQLDRLRADFVASVSHDLRTPLTAVRAGLGMLETAAAERLQAEERALLGSARRGAERLGVLIDDLLAYNQFESGTMRLEPAPLDLRAAVADAMGTIHPLIRRKGQTLEVDLPEPLPVEGDLRRLGQVVVNLLSNAHEHTPAGSRIAIAGRADPTEVRLAVSDDGPGIPPAELEAVFARFHRLDAVAGGSGLGLAIVRGLVELHRGRVWAEQRPGGGTIVTVVLPRLRDERDA